MLDGTLTPAAKVALRIEPPAGAGRNELIADSGNRKIKKQFTLNVFFLTCFSFCGTFRWHPLLVGKQFLSIAVTLNNEFVKKS